MAGRADLGRKRVRVALRARRHRPGTRWLRLDQDPQGGGGAGGGRSNSRACPVPDRDAVDGVARGAAAAEGGEQDRGGRPRYRPRADRPRAFHPGCAGRPAGRRRCAARRSEDASGGGRDEAFRFRRAHHVGETRRMGLRQHAAAGPRAPGRVGRLQGRIADRPRRAGQAQRARRRHALPSVVPRLPLHGR